ncbi:MAG: diphthamide biosynthesis enzyme Dph2 [Candidatus Bathyarchaeota archaeon]|nr:MAG: diphthamide biosynthesis enzyme Dph2 [Candidatus Bathyarchaeota archaeon]
MITEITKRAVKRVLLQFPEGLITAASRISKLIEDNTEALTIVSMDPCYGACDLPIYQAKKLEVDLIIHFGHTPYTTEEDIPILYLEIPSNIDILKTIRKALRSLKGYQKIGLATTVQHVPSLQIVKRFLEEKGLTPIIGKKRGKIKYDGQILGCDYSTMQDIDDSVDIFLLIGSMFHALGATLTLSRNIILADPYQNRVIDMRERKRTELKRRWARISKAREIADFGIILSSKTGQFRLDEAIRIKRLLEDSNKRGILLISSEVSPKILENFTSFKAYVNTACPRITIDDAQQFRRTILSIEDVEIMMGKKKWDSHVNKIYPEDRT